jgi:hypothetical protein
LYVPLLSYLSPREEEKDLLPSFQDDVWILLGICISELSAEKNQKALKRAQGEALSTSDKSKFGIKISFHKV